MTLTPEERRKIYEEEKARIESEQSGAYAEKTATLDLKPGTAGVLCYLGGWISGIIFLVLEQKDRLIRFHAVQSIVVFGSLHIASLLLGQIPLVGRFFGIIILISAFILWIILMVKASQGYFSLPVAGELADKILGTAPATSGEKTTASPPPPPQPVATEPAPKAVRSTSSGRAGRIAVSVFAIAFNIALLVFFNFYHDYIAYYHMESIGGAMVWVREPILTTEYANWLPIINTILLFSIAGHSLLLAFDKYILREGILLILNIFSIVAIGALLVLFPFDFGVFGKNFNATIDFSVRITLVLIIFGISIGILVRLIKIIVNGIRGTATY